MNRPIPPRVARRFAAAEGYHELGMASHAMEELERIDDAGVWEASHSFLKGLALKAEKRFSDAVESFHRAAELLPVSQRQPVWSHISECFDEAGYKNLAAVAKQTAEVAGRRESDLANQLEARKGLARIIRESVARAVDQAVAGGLDVPATLTIEVKLVSGTERPETQMD
jgi:hypothetical protein